MPSDNTADRDPALFAPGTFGCHEAMHMASVLCDEVGVRLGEHPAIEMNPVWHAKAMQAQELLFSLYQDIAQEHMKEPTNGK